MSIAFRKSIPAHDGGLRVLHINSAGPALLSPPSIPLPVTTVFITFPWVRVTLSPRHRKPWATPAIWVHHRPIGSSTGSPVPSLCWPLPASRFGCRRGCGFSPRISGGLSGEQAPGRSGGYTTPRPGVSPFNPPAEILLSFQTTAFHCAVGQRSGGRGRTTPLKMGGRMHCSLDSAWRRGETAPPRLVFRWAFRLLRPGVHPAPRGHNPARIRSRADDLPPSLRSSGSTGADAPDPLPH